MKVTVTLAALALATTVGLAHARPADPTVGVFAQSAALSNAFELAEAKIVLEDSTNPALRAFAREMMGDHGMAQQQLDRAGRMAGVPTNFVFDKISQSQVDDIGLMDGKKLDDTYLDDQIKAHASAAATLASYASTGSNAALRAYARETLPVVLMHQHMLEQMSGQPAPM